MVSRVPIVGVAPTKDRGYKTFKLMFIGYRENGTLGLWGMFCFRISYGNFTIAYFEVNVNRCFES